MTRRIVVTLYLPLEMGAVGRILALGLEKHIVLVGPAPNVFATLPGIPRYATWAEVVTHLVEWKDAMESAAVRQRLRRVQ